MTFLLASYTAFLFFFSSLSAVRSYLLAIKISITFVTFVALLTLGFFVLVKLSLKSD
jgi:hypothetical protein